MESTLQERITTAMRHAEKTQADVARNCGLSQGAVWRWVSGRSKGMSAENADAVARYLGVRAEWLGAGRGPMTASVVAVPDGSTPPVGSVAIPEYCVRFGAGNAFPPTFEEAHESVPVYYREDWLLKKGVRPDNCKMFRVCGDSMLPLLYDGDRILVDCTPGRPIISGRVYAFVYGPELRVKRLYTQVNGNILVVSENPAVSNEEIPASDLDRFVMVGRVIDRSGDGPF